ncbi:MAG: 5,6-dimethylbenzimidazole synthase [Candidatus Omnitrophica bacterium]|nr:5,6-dimethylbenzimidazole synthase [Candidatus Omnitrophota bacterium]
MNRDHSLDDTLITAEERNAVYKTIYGRRDIRSLFKSDLIPQEVLARILQAAHHAGSVGYMQPWNFILVDDPEIKQRTKEAFLKERGEAALLFEGERQEKYLSYKLEGILESPVNLLITSDPTRFGPQVIGRHSMPETHLYSTCCAIQNLWLAARAENIGVGWVSIFKREDLYEIFNIPRKIAIVAYLCLGYVTHFPDKPDLERAGWGKRLPLKELVYFNQWGGAPSENWQGFHLLLREPSEP